jgi:aldose 1-epimerase
VTDVVDTDLVELSLGSVRGVVSRWGASLVGLTVDGRHLVEPVVGSPRPPLAAGATLVPWPNRVAGSTWSSGGRTLRLEATEPDTGHALHGLLHDVRWDVGRRSADAVTLVAQIRQATGYPFDLDVAVEHRLTTDGVEVRCTTTNVAAAGRAPVAVGAHPYLRCGRAPVEDLVVTIEAGAALDLDDEGIPRGAFGTAGTPYDLHDGVAVRDVVPHACFTGLAARQGTVRHVLADPVGGGRTTLWADEEFGYAQLFVTDLMPGRKAAIAIEPMTAPPDALRSGHGLRWVGAGQSWSVRWGIDGHAPDVA